MLRQRDLGEALEPDDLGRVPVGRVLNLVVTDDGDRCRCGHEPVEGVLIALDHRFPGRMENPELLLTASTAGGGRSAG